MSLVGGTLGLLTGLNLIGVVDTIYWLAKYLSALAAKAMRHGKR